ncbi:MAG TPA: carbohydrate-binding protein CenC [Ruminococcus sp.]|nr:carbohydrate-binding protein CenC [Ruminococcus sp.]
MQFKKTITRLCTATLSGAMLLTMAPETAIGVNAISPDSNGIFCHDTFEDSSGNWEARGEGEILLSGRHPFKGTNALLIKDRTKAWHGIQMALDPSTFKAGQRYSFNVFVDYEEGEDTQNFLLSMQYTDSTGTVKYPHIAEGSTSRGQYLLLSNPSYQIPEDATDVYIYVETTDVTGNFYIDEAIVAAEGVKVTSTGEAEGYVPPMDGRGDLDLNGKISISDLVLFRQSMERGFANDMSRKAADIDGDDDVDNDDLSYLQDYVLKKTDRFPTLKPKVDFDAMAGKFGYVDPAASYKKSGENNPLISQYFGADPGVMEYNGRVYIFMTDDHLLYKNGQLTDIEYGTINCLRCISSDDLVNWTDHGLIQAAGQNGLCKWGGNSWAPTACHKKVNGKEKFFLYFANGGNGIAVLEADSPTGPWRDPIGKALISRSTPNCGNVEWLFDPAVLVDDDGTGYLYFGGGVPSGQNSHPKTARCVKLNDDMTSIVGTPQTIDAPYLFEDSGIHKFNGKYYYSYCSNFNTYGNPYGMTSGAINYMVSDSPLGPFTYKGEAFKGIGTFFGTGGNNHHTFFKFNNQWYLTYHAQYLQDSMGLKGGYRSTHIDKVTINSDGTIQAVKGTKTGVPQIKSFDPYRTNRAATFSHQGGITISGSGNSVVQANKGSWFRVTGADCGNAPQELTIKASSPNGCIVKVCTGSASGTPVAYAEIPAGSYMQEITVPVVGLSGKNDLCFVFNNTASVDSWKLG